MKYLIKYVCVVLVSVVIGVFIGKQMYFGYSKIDGKICLLDTLTELSKDLDQLTIEVQNGDL